LSVENCSQVVDGGLCCYRVALDDTFTRRLLGVLSCSIHEDRDGLLANHIAGAVFEHGAIVVE
jgi:hypothetical protein